MSWTEIMRTDVIPPELIGQRYDRRMQSYSLGDENVWTTSQVEG